MSNKRSALRYRTSIAALIAGWLVILGDDAPYDYVPYDLPRHLHEDLALILTASTVIAVVAIGVGLLGKVHARLGELLHCAERATADTAGYGEGVIDGMRLAAVPADEDPTIDLRPAVGGTVSVLRGRRR